MPPFEAKTAPFDDMNDPVFMEGDHVVSNCKGGWYNHHMIVVENHVDGSAQVADFFGVTPPDDGAIHRLVGDSMMSSLKTDSNKTSTPADAPIKTGCFRFITLYPQDLKLLQKVVYGCSHWDFCCAKAGTATTANASDKYLVLERVQFLAENMDAIGNYQVLKCNCETVACWCKTGTWCTLQVAAALVKITGSVTVGGAALHMAAVVGLTSTELVTVTSAGLWGFFGWTEEVVVTVAANPFVLAAISATTVISFGSVAWKARDVVRYWMTKSKTMNGAFESWQNRAEV